MRIRFLIPVLIASSLLSACASETPTGPSSGASTRPALNTGGGWMGGGGKVAPDSTTTTTADAGGGWMGGGGKVAPDTTTVDPQ